MKRRQERYLSLPVIAVISAIAYIYLTTVFIYIERWYGLSSSQGIMNAAAFTAVAAMCVYTYAIAVLREPGWVPPNYIPDIEDTNNPVHEIKRKSGDLRFCNKCSHYKPPRAHHCRSCKRCVLKMDHHCIWIDNCVGHANYKIFLIFVMYAAIACVYSLVMLIGSLTGDSANDGNPTIYVVSGVVVTPVGVALLILLGWHVCLISQNKTTIEYHAGVRSMWVAQKEADFDKHPYDIGLYDNLTVVLGQNVFCWIFPSSHHIGSGLRFRTAYDDSDGRLE